MKTAEEWYLTSPKTLDVIRQIQLDAWKQGMSDAHDIIRDQWDTFKGFPHRDIVTKAILTARDNKKSL